MDEVHQELIRLKQRVSEMAAAYSCSPPRLPSRMTEDDAFLANIVDAKAHLDSIQASLLINNETRRGARTGYSDVCGSNGTSPAHTASLLPHQGLILPSAPLFWSLFNSLRTDVRSLDRRVGDLEQSVSNLEDRVDHCLDPFTPASSATDATVKPSLQDLQNPLSAPIWTEPGTYGDGRAESAYPAFSNAASYHGHQKSVELDATYSGTEQLSSYSHQLPLNYWPASDVVDTLAPEGVAFRDKEISDLEELNRSTQDALRRSEESSRERQKYIQELENANAELERKLSERDGCLATCSKVLGDKHAELEKIRVECQAKDAALHMWASNYWSESESSRRKQDELSAANQQLQHMYDLQGSRQDEFDEIVDAKNDELRRLRAFCESKDEVIGKQEEIIARGVDLMEQKDDDIERVTRNLKLLEDDLNSETREKERFSRLFEERGKWVAQLRSSLSYALTPKMTERRPEAPAVTPEAMYSPFATSGPELHASHVSKWSPMPLRQARLPSERQRAAIWKAGPRPHTFGQSGWTDADIQNCDSVRLLERLALTEESSPQEQDRARANREERARFIPQYRGFSTSSKNRAQPEQLPPLPPRRRISLAEIQRGPSQPEPSEPITKHASMQELRRSGLQPYIETVEEDVRD